MTDRGALVMRAELARVREGANRNPDLTRTWDRMADLKRTPLYALNVELGGKMVPFAGYDMPVQFPAGILKEHLHTRAAAGLFDVSHMGQAILHLEGARATHDAIAALIETLTPGEIKALKPGQIRYTLLLNDEGGIRDDFMVTRPATRRMRGHYSSSSTPAPRTPTSPTSQRS